MIVTNHHPRDLLYYYELTPKQQAWVQEEHDWLATSDTCSFDSVQFVPYKDWIFTTECFMKLDQRRPGELAGWDGYTNDSMCSGTLLKYIYEDWGEATGQVVMGWFCS